MASAAIKTEESEEIRVSLQREKSPSFCREKKRCFASSSPSSSCGARDRQCGLDRMVKTELDAAQTLTDLAQLALFEAGNPSRDEKWGNKGRRSRKRLKNEARARGSSKGVRESEITRSMPWEPSNLVEPPSVDDSQRHKKICKYIPRRAIKAQIPSDMSTPVPECSTSHMRCHRGKSKQILSEVEKEAKRLRRILANRESARQTILRRQAFCEELTKKAAELSCDNESMKREKALVMNEYQSLKDRNKQLKMQVAKTIPGEYVIKSEVEETPAEVFSTHVEKPSSSSMQLSQLVYSRPPFTSFAWPPVFPFQTRSLTQSTGESQDSVTTCIANPYHQWGNSGVFGVGWPRMPFYMPPCPWFYPPPSHWSGSCTLNPHRCRERDVDAIDHQCDLSSKEMGNTETAFSITKCKNDAPSSREFTAKRENATNCEKRQDSRSEMLRPCTKDMTLMTTPLRMLPLSLNVKSENVPEQDLESEEAVSSTVDCTVCATENFQGTSIYPSKKQADMAAAAKARKRRKELTKLKNLQTQKLRLPC